MNYYTIKIGGPRYYCEVHGTAGKQHFNLKKIHKGLATTSVAYPDWLLDSSKVKTMTAVL